MRRILLAAVLMCLAGPALASPPPINNQKNYVDGYHDFDGGHVFMIVCNYSQYTHLWSYQVGYSYHLDYSTDTDAGQLYAGVSSRQRGQSPTLISCGTDPGGGVRLGQLYCYNCRPLMEDAVRTDNADGTTTFGLKNTPREIQWLVKVGRYGQTNQWTGIYDFQDIRFPINTATLNTALQDTSQSHVFRLAHDDVQIVP